MTRRSGFGEISKKAKIGLFLLIIVFILIVIAYIMFFSSTPPGSKSNGINNSPPSLSVSSSPSGLNGTYILQSVFKKQNMDKPGVSGSFLSVNGNMNDLRNPNLNLWTDASGPPGQWIITPVQGSPNTYILQSVFKKQNMDKPGVSGSFLSVNGNMNDLRNPNLNLWTDASGPPGQWIINRI